MQAAPAYDAAAGYYGSGAPASTHFVQVAAFLDQNRAERLVRKLQAAGESPIVTQGNVRGKLWHRVRIPALDKADARMVQGRVRGLGYYEARMVRG